jgi:hypothetical protein
VLRIRNASYTDNGLYQCILSNSMVSAVRNFTLNVRNTRPHCIEDAQMDCAGETGFDLRFRKGYDGGHPQLFRLFYRQIGDDNIFNAWESTREFEEETLRLEGLERFAKYQFFLETQNLLGATNCTLKDQYSKSQNCIIN